jgi:hypothetical protein
MISYRKTLELFDCFKPCIIVFYSFVETEKDAYIFIYRILDSIKNKYLRSLFRLNCTVLNMINMPS